MYDVLHNEFQEDILSHDFCYALSYLLGADLKYQKLKSVVLA